VELRSRLTCSLWAVRAGLVFAAVLAAATVCAAGAVLESPAREISADIISRDPRGAGSATVAHLYAGHGKVRIEPSDMPDDFFLINPESSSTTLLIRPSRHQFMSARQSSVLTQVFIPVDVFDPCKQWRTAVEDARAGAGIERWRCERLKPLAFRTAGAGEPADERVLDPKLQFPVKIIAADGSSLTLENIRLMLVPAELFAVPGDYRRFEPRAVVERIKQSDVWAAPPAQ
jgi:hypothetical protein